MCFHIYISSRLHRIESRSFNSNSKTESRILERPDYYTKFSIYARARNSLLITHIIIIKILVEFIQLRISCIRTVINVFKPQCGSQIELFAQIERQIQIKCMHTSFCNPTELISLCRLTIKFALVRLQQIRRISSRSQVAWKIITVFFLVCIQITQISQLIRLRKSHGIGIVGNKHMIEIIFLLIVKSEIQKFKRGSVPMFADDKTQIIKRQMRIILARQRLSFLSQHTDCTCDITAPIKSDSGRIGRHDRYISSQST